MERLMTTEPSSKRLFFPPDIGNNPFLFTYSSDALWFFPLNLGKTTTGRQRAELRFGADERIGYEEQEASKRARN